MSWVGPDPLTARTHANASAILPHLQRTIMAMSTSDGCKEKLSLDEGSGSTDATIQSGAPE